MKTKFVILTVLFCALSINKAQRTVEEKGEFYTKFLNYEGRPIPLEEVEVDLKAYEKFYNKTVTKLKKLDTYKNSFYGKSLSTFLEELKKDDLRVIEGVRSNYNDNEASQPNGVELSFIDYDVKSSITYKANQPGIDIIFIKAFDNKTSTDLHVKNKAQWNDNMIEFYKDMIIKEIRFKRTSGLYAK